MIPALVDHEDGPGWPLLPPGIHDATLDEVEQAFATDDWRRLLFLGLKNVLKVLQTAGCRCVYLDGSFVSGKRRPGDFDLCWKVEGVRARDLPPEFVQVKHPGRARLKEAYGGDVFPAFVPLAGSFVEYFQQDKTTGLRKGILEIDLTREVNL